MMKVLNLLKFPAVRHILAGVGICVAIYFFAISPLQNEIDKLHKQIDKDRGLIRELSKRDTYKIENRIDSKKLKDGSTINMVPSSEIKVENKGDTLRLKDFEIIEEKKYRKHWWQFWREKK